MLYQLSYFRLFRFEKVSSSSLLLARILIYGSKLRCSLVAFLESAPSKRKTVFVSTGHLLQCLFMYVWGEKDSNLRRRAPADLQSAPVGHFGISCSGQLSYIGSSYFWDCKDKSFLKNTKTILKILKLSSDKDVRPGPITAVTGAFS